SSDPNAAAAVMTTNEPATKNSASATPQIESTKTMPCCASAAPSGVRVPTVCSKIIPEATGGNASGSASSALLALPLAFPPVASGIILLQTVGTRTPLGAALAQHGIVFVDSIWGVALAEFFVAGSFVVITAAAAFGSL